MILPIIHRAAELFGVTYCDNFKIDTALRINADHARATAFLIHDGVTPSNEGRGYVLRKIMRRAMRNARLIGREEPYLYELAGFIAELMRPSYPELMESVPRVARVVKDEEHRYATTFLVAERVFQDEVKSLTGTVLPGSVSFKLYDSYGLAFDEQEEMARERGITLDREDFDAEMQQQRERARASWRGADKTVVAPAYAELLRQGRTKFLGYGELSATGRVLGLLVNHEPGDHLDAGIEAELVLDRTSFYAETGGQVGDRGMLYSASGEAIAIVGSAYPAVPGLTVHRITTLGPIHIGDELRAEVDQIARQSTTRNHTATHLLHAALRQVLGTHVKQAGSVVEPPRLRFDFTHYSPLDQSEIIEIERLVNEQIRANEGVTTDVLPIEQALSTGAMALFGEKYGEQVRVVSIQGFSKELCGGTHVNRAGDIGVFKIANEGSISAGVRRIEAITGDAAVQQFQSATDSLHRIARMIRVSEPELVEQMERVLTNQRSLEKQVDQLKQKLAQSAAAGLETQARSVNGAKVLAARVDGMDRQQLRSLADSLRNKWKSAVIVLASADDGAVSIVSAVTKDLTAKVQAGKLVGSVAQAVGGKGGGRPDMAEGGGKDAAELGNALEEVYKLVESQL